MKNISKIVIISALCGPACLAAAKTKAVKPVVSRTLLVPDKLVEARLNRIVLDLKSRPAQPQFGSNPPQLTSGWNKASWLNSIYSAGLVEVSWATQMLSDKLLFYRLAERELGDRVARYFPKTLGLRGFLHKHKLILKNGELRRDGDAIESALHDEFPNGFAARPAVGVAPNETGSGLYTSSADFIADLLVKGSSLYQPSHAFMPIKSSLLQAIASGEAIVLQEDVVGLSHSKGNRAAKSFRQIRIHTYSYQVVPDSSPRKWMSSATVAQSEIHKAEFLVEDFLKTLQQTSPQLMQRIALGFDVALVENGELKIIDTIGNRGLKGSWSGYLDQPRVLGAYARHFEEIGVAQFSGVGGVLLRRNFFNYFPYWELRVEKSQAGLAKILAFLPPLP